MIPESAVTFNRAHPHPSTSPCDQSLPQPSPPQPRWSRCSEGRRTPSVNLKGVTWCLQRLQTGSGNPVEWRAWNFWRMALERLNYGGEKEERFKDASVFSRFASSRYQAVYRDGTQNISSGKEVMCLLRDNKQERWSHKPLEVNYSEFVLFFFIKSKSEAQATFKQKGQMRFVKANWNTGPSCEQSSETR